MNAELITAYRKERAARPYLSASQCLKIAQYNLRMERAEFPRYAGDAVTMKLPHGESIRIALEHDDDADIDDRLQVETERMLQYEDVTEHASNGWIARDGRVLFDAAGNRSSRYDWLWWSDNYGFAQMWEDGKRGHSRHDAWLRARELIAQSFKCYTEAREDGYVGYVVTLHDAEGEELDRDSVWGFEASGDYAGQEAYAAAQAMAEERAEYWVQKLNYKRGMMRQYRERFAELASEYRAMRSLPDAQSFPLSIEHLRDRLDVLRGAHRDALRVVLA